MSVFYTIYPETPKENRANIFDPNFLTLNLVPFFTSTLTLVALSPQFVSILVSKVNVKKSKKH